MKNKIVGITLVAYGLWIAALVYAVHQMAPASTRPTLIAGLTGGMLSLLWGIQWLRGRGRKVWPVSTLAVVCYVILGQAVTAWMRGGATMVASFITLALATSLGVLMRVVYHGVFRPTPSHPAREQSAGPNDQRDESRSTRTYDKAA